MGVALPVIVEPTSPFIYLPKSSCDAIAANLPVTYQSALGLYTWDVISTAYQQIITSPAFLSFTFRLNSSVTQNLTINVPFRLLNLTLTAPLVSKPTQYFPCNSFDYGKSYGFYQLGKAFLQAALLESTGSSMEMVTSFSHKPLDQIHQAKQMPNSLVSTTLSSLPRRMFGRTRGKALGFQSQIQRQGALMARLHLHLHLHIPKTSSGLAAGAIAGIVVGVVVIILFALGGFWFWRRGTADQAEEHVEDQPSEHLSSLEEMDGTEKIRWGMADQHENNRAELRGDYGQVELPG